MESRGRIRKVSIILYTNTAEGLFDTFSEHKRTAPFDEYLTKNTSQLFKSHHWRNCDEQAHHFNKKEKLLKEDIKGK